MSQRQIHVLVDEADFPSPIAAALRRVGADIRLTSIDRELKRPSAVKPDARLVVTSNRHDQRHRELAALFAGFEKEPCPTLVLTPAASRLSAEMPPSADGSLGFACDLSADELVGRLTAMCDLRRPLDRLYGELDDLRRRDRQHSESMRYLGEQMRLAGQVQRDMLPSPPHCLHGARVRTFCYRPADQVSGDLYGITRLDAEHVALSLADATGHGLPAALLTMFVRRGMRGTEGTNGSRRVLQPAEVLLALHEELLEAALSHCQFVAALYAVYHEPSRTLRWARAGAPCPILLRAGESPRQLPSEGVVLGVLDQVAIEPAETVLEPNDMVLLHTDGLDSFLVHHPRHAGSLKSVSPPCADLSGTGWFQALTSNSLTDRLQDLETGLDQTPRGHWPIDDVTILALEIAG